jgi:hypothetical protein
MSKSTYILAAAALMTIGSVIPAFGRDGKSASLRAKLSGFNEVIPAGGAVFSDGSGRFRGRIAADQQSIGYELTYQVVETVATVDTQYVNQAHLHFGQRHTTGGIIAWLCDSADNPSPVASTPTCPSPGGIVKGTLIAADVVALAGQVILAGDFAALVEAVRVGAIYANVHTDAFAAGELRGQVHDRVHD